MKKIILIGILLLIGGFCFAQIQNPFKYGYGEEVVIKPTDEMRTEAGAIYNSEEMKNLSEPERTKQTWQKWLQQQDRHPEYFQYRNYIVTDVVVKNGATQEIYISPPALPLISPCDKGIGPCLLFLFDKFLRFLYTASLAIGVLILIIAGIGYMTAKDENSAKGAQAKLKYGIIGVSIAILAFTIVTAIERGFTEELATTPTGGGAGGGGAGGQVALSTVNIYTPRITNEGKFTFMYGTDQGNCDFLCAIYDLDTGEQIGCDMPGGRLSASTQMNIFSQNINLTKHGGHRLRVTFMPSEEGKCIISQKFVDLTAPTVTIVAQNPKIFIDKMKIDGTQWIYIKLPENITLSDVLQTALKAGAQYYLYDPPFNVRIYFSTDQPAQKNGRCYVAAILRGVSVPYVDVYNLKSVTVKEFRKYFEFALDYSKNRKDFVTTIPLSLDNNIVRGVHVEIYGYRGDCTMDMPQDLGFININE
jgi:hypothetical protein